MAEYIERQAAIDLFYPVDPENDGSDGCTVVYKTENYTSDEIEAVISGPPAATGSGGETAVRPARSAGGGEHGQAEGVAGGVAPGTAGAGAANAAGSCGPGDEPQGVECTAPGGRRVGGCPWLTHCV